MLNNNQKLVLEFDIKTTKLISEKNQLFYPMTITSSFLLKYVNLTLTKRILGF